MDRIYSLSDPREDDYGGYSQTIDELYEYMDYICTYLEPMLKHGGKLILKCADQFHVEANKFYPFHLDWIQRAESCGLKMIDMFIHAHHRISPTAFQVKNRSSSIIMHTYFLVFQKEKVFLTQ